MANFRKNFITKCMGDADTDLLNEVLTGHIDVDVVQLRNYTWRHTIPDSHRVQLYKHLLGISSCYHETRDVVEKHRREEAQVLLRSLCTMRAFSGSYTGDQPLPSSWDIVKMILLARGQLSEKLMDRRFEPTSVGSRSITAMLVVTRQVNVLCPSDWVEVFLISRQLIGLLEEQLDKNVRENIIEEVKEEVNSALMLDDDLQPPYWQVFDIDYWLRCAMCNLINTDRAIWRVLDKICTGQCVVSLMRALCVDYIVHTDKLIQRGEQYVNESKKLRCMSSEGEMRMVNRAIESTFREMNAKGAGRVERSRISLT